MHTMAPVSTSDELIAAAYLMGYLVPTVAVSVRLARRLSADGVDQAFLGTLFGIAQAVGVPLAMLMIGAMNRNSVLIAHLAVAGAVFVTSTRGEPRLEQRRERPSIGSASAIGVVAAFVAVSVVLSLAGPSRDFDSRNYHLVAVANWMQGHSLWSFGFHLPGAWAPAYPSNAEVAGLWLGLPTHSDLLSLLAPVLFALLGILAAAVLCRDLGGNPALGAFAGVAVFAAPIIFWSQTRALGTDGAAAAGIIAAAALIVRATKDTSSKWVGAAGVALGLGLGTKYTAILPGAVLVIVAAVVLRPRTRWLWLVPGVLVFLAPWLVRNALETGNPFFPQTLKIAGIGWAGSDHPLIDLGTPIADHLIEGRRSIIRHWLGDLARNVGPVLLVAALGAVAGFARRRSATSRAVSFVTLAAAVGYMVTPFTGAGARLTTLNIRYLLTALVVGAAVAASVRARLVVAVLVGASLAYDAVRVLQGQPGNEALDVSIRVALVAAVGGLLATGIARRRPISMPGRRAIGVIALAAVVLGWIGTAAVIHRTNARYVPTALERLVERVRADGRSVEVIRVDDLRSLLGRRFDVRLRTPPISRDGIAAETLDASLRASPARVLVLSRGPAFAYGIPTDYQPPEDWCLAGQIRTESVFVRRPGRLLPARGLSCL